MIELNYKILLYKTEYLLRESLIPNVSKFNTIVSNDLGVLKYSDHSIFINDNDLFNGKVFLEFSKFNINIYYESNNDYFDYNLIKYIDNNLNCYENLDINQVICENHYYPYIGKYALFKPYVGNSLSLYKLNAITEFISFLGSGIASSLDPLSFHISMNKLITDIDLIPGITRKIII